MRGERKEVCPHSRSHTRGARAALMRMRKGSKGEMAGGPFLVVRGGRAAAEL